jgi:hypothetical protein
MIIDLQYCVVRGYIFAPNRHAPFLIPGTILGVYLREVAMKYGPRFLNETLK